MEQNVFTHLSVPILMIRKYFCSFRFQRRFGLPGVIGCIDCTHIAIVKPNQEEHLFYNRKGHHSLNVQIVEYINL